MHPRELTPSITNYVLKMLQLQLNFVISLPPFRVPSSQTFNFPPPRWLAALLAHCPSPCSLSTQADSSGRKAACQALAVATLIQRVPCPASVALTLALVVPSRALAPAP